jgi:hypothetical protein
MFVIGGWPRAGFTDQAGRLGRCGRLAASLNEPAAMTDDILFDRRGTAGLVTLNRRRHSVPSPMPWWALRAQLDRWASIAAITRMVILAGGVLFRRGDIRALYDPASRATMMKRCNSGGTSIPQCSDKNYRKPYVALIDSIAMGGSVSVSVRKRIVLRRSFSFPCRKLALAFSGRRRHLVPTAHAGAGTYCIDGDPGIATPLRGHRDASHSIRTVWCMLDGLTGAVPVDAVLSAFGICREGPVAQRKAAINRLLTVLRHS